MLRKALYIRQVASRLLAARKRARESSYHHSPSRIKKISRTTPATYTLAVADGLINDLSHFVVGIAHSGRALCTLMKSSGTVRL